MRDSSCRREASLRWTLVLACTCLLDVVAAQQQLTIGTGLTLRVSSNLTISSTSITCTLSDGLTNVTSLCLQLTSLLLPDHPAGPWCNGGFWSASADGVAKRVFLSGIAVNCNCQRNSCNSSCNDVCLECPLAASSTTFVVPLSPQAGAASLSPTGDNNHGQGLALNGVPLAPADPYAFLTGANNIAPLDRFGGHATLQYVYHYHGIPTSYFNCSQGWDAVQQTWSTSAPDGQHSPLIGWMLDGLPAFGPFSNGGTLPTDLNSCRAHSHAPYGMHYHAGFAHDTQNSFLSCFTYRRAIQSWDSSTTGPPGGGGGGPGGGGPGGGGPGGRRLSQNPSSITCPTTTTMASHTTFSLYAANVSSLPTFSATTCGVATTAPPPPLPPGATPSTTPSPPPGVFPVTTPSSSPPTSEASSLFARVALVVMIATMLSHQ